MLETDRGISSDALTQHMDEDMTFAFESDAMAPVTPPLPENNVVLDCNNPRLDGRTFISRSELRRKADVFDRVFSALNGLGHGLNADLRVLNDDAKSDIQDFANGSYWHLDDMNLNAEGLFASYGKAAGLYAGVGLAADAFRYAVLRDEGADCATVERARSSVRNGLRMLDTAHRITGTPGVLPRAIAVKGWPGDGANTTTPLFNDNGEPLPIEKNNGTWREDVSGDFPQHCKE